MGYAVVRTDKMWGTDQRAALVSVKYQVSGNPAAIENGNVVELGDLIDGEREIYAAAAPSVDTPLNKLVLIATPEVMYDVTKQALDSFINEKDRPARGYLFYDNGMFSVTKEALVGVASPAVGDIVELAAGTKLNVVAKATGATAGSTVVGKIDAIETAGRYTYYVIHIQSVPAEA